MKHCYVHKKQSLPLNSISRLQDCDEYNLISEQETFSRAKISGWQHDSIWLGSRI